MGGALYCGRELAGVRDSKTPEESTDCGVSQIDVNVSEGLDQPNTDRNGSREGETDLGCNNVTSDDLRGLLIALGKAPALERAVLRMLLLELLRRLDLVQPRD